MKDEGPRNQEEVEVERTTGAKMVSEQMVDQKPREASGMESGVNGVSVTEQRLLSDERECKCGLREPGGLQTNPLTLRMVCEKSSPHPRRRQAERKECRKKRPKLQRSLLSWRGGDKGDRGSRAGQLSK